MSWMIQVVDERVKQAAHEFIINWKTEMTVKKIWVSHFILLKKMSKSDFIQNNLQSNVTYTQNWLAS